MSVGETALFEALNAKKLSPAEVAATFVVPPQYEQLVGPDHAFLVGPRGSGKTTLLRMLQGQALMAWHHPRASIYRRRVRYSSVFLPADRLWTSQLTTTNHGSPLGVAAFTTQMLYALVETMLYRIGDHSASGAVHHPAELTHRSEVELVAECAAAWELTLRSGSLRGLQGALDLRLNEIANLIESSVPVETADWSRLNPLEAFRFGIRAFNRHAGEPSHRWALLLDEMELAPESVHRALRGALRGGEQTLVLKLSFSPFDRFVSSSSRPGEGVPDNDFRPIYLWYGTRIGSRRFTHGLWRRMMSEAVEGRPRPAAAVLGTSEIDASGATWRKEAYQPGSKQLKLVSEMWAKDTMFREYLARRMINLEHVDELSYEQRSATLRKVYPLLVFRDAVLTFSNGMPQRRSRKKVTECFTGADAVFAALEGNPRWVKAVFSRLLASYDGGGQVSRGLQYDTLTEAAERFESLLRLLPTGADFPGPSVLSLVDDIARYFSDRSFGAFSADPPSVFNVDSEVPDRILGALETALSAGAIVHLRGKRSPVVLNDLRGERFRLAYLLTIRDGLEVPLRLGKTTNLSTILRWASTTNPSAVSSDRASDLPTLWDVNGE